MTDSIAQNIAAKALIVDETGRVLILREASYDGGTNAGKYGLPGGRINPGEAFLEGLRREVSEETGLEIDILGPVHVDEWTPTIRGVRTQIVGMFMICRPRSTDIKLNEEHDVYQWVHSAELDQFKMKPQDAAAIKAWGK